MSAALFLWLGSYPLMGYDGAVYLMGWTGGYFLPLLPHPTFENLEFTVPDFWRTIIQTVHEQLLLFVLLWSLYYLCWSDARCGTCIL
jgi:Na+(H+)/acetate symporter ActP